MRPEDRDLVESGSEVAGDRGPRQRVPWWGLVALAALGVLLATLGHVAAWARTGDPAYIADSDEILYLAWSRDAVIDGAGRLTDAVHARSGPVMHPWLLFVPPAWLAHELGLGMTGIGPLWRALGGAGIALGLFAAIRPAVRDPRVALGVAACLLFDAGLLFGDLLLREAVVLTSLVRGGESFFDGVPRVMAHLRVVPPALAIPFLLAHYGLTLRARTSGGHGAALLAAASFGLLFHVYFYFWSLALVGTVAAFALDPRGRRLYATIAVVGLALGAPALVAGYLVKASTAPDWLHRTDKFVPIGHFRELLIPKLLIAGWVALACWVFRRRRELTYLWCCTGAGLLCSNQQIVTGLQIENYHWRLALGITFSVLLGTLFAPWLFEPPETDDPRRGGSRRRAILIGLLAVQVTIGLFLRWREVTRTTATRHWASVYRQTREDSFRLPKGAVIAGDPDRVLVAAVLGQVNPLSGWLVEFSSQVTDPELDERLLLNLFLRGTDRAAARRLVDRPPGTLGWEALATRSPEAARRQRDRRRGLIVRIWDDPAPWIKKFGVTHVIRPVAQWSPDHLAGLAALVKSGRHGELWEVRRLGVPDRPRSTP